MRWGFTRLVSLVLLLSCATGWAEDRADRNADAAKQARDGNQQQLQPQMLNYLNQAREHLEKADQAEQKKDQGTAERERKLAQMEQMKAQKTQEQMKANEKSAQGNVQAENKLRENPDAKETQKGKPEQNKVITVRLGETMTEPKTAPAPEVSVPAAQLAQLEDFRAQQEAMKNRLANEVTRAVESKPAVPSEPTKNLERDMKAAETRAATVTFSDNEKAGGASVAAGERAPASAGSTSAASAGASALPVGASAAQSGGATGDAGFWKGVGDLAFEGEAGEKAEKSTNDKLGLRGLRGSDAAAKEKLAGLPSDKMSDEAFWKKVGKDPRECRPASGKARSKCLRDARRSIEKRWRAAETKRPTAPTTLATRESEKR